jgi:Protein of unknown function (DUF3617)
MAKFLVFTVTCLASATTAGLACAEPAGLQAGAYEVQVSLELPYVEDTGARTIATVCVTGAEANDNRGLVVLSGNNPLGHCPAANFHRDGDTLTFDIACPGGNAAIASAKYVFGAQSFRGRIAMKMGGKNMTMTETQVGRRVGECAPPAPPHS